MSTILYLGLFGLVGIFSRFGIDQLGVDQNQKFPVTTFFINIIGCALAALFYLLAEKYSWSSQIRTGLLVGFCGGFTTFSAYALQSALMMEEGRYWPAIIYWTLSPVIGLVTVLIILKVSRFFLILQ